MRRALPIMLAACSYSHGATGSPNDDADVDVPMLTDVHVPHWSAPQPLVDLNSGAGDDDPSLTDDLKEIYWGSKRLDAADEDIFYATRADVTSPWSTPPLVPNIYTTSQETTSRVSGLGLALYFASNRSGEYQLYATTRNSRTSAWGTDSIIGFSSTSLNE